MKTTNSNRLRTSGCNCAPAKEERDKVRESQKIENKQRLRAIVEFIDGDFNREPMVYPQAGTAEADDKIRAEIMKRWER
jgi:hypothetical protein